MSVITACTRYHHYETLILGEDMTDVIDWGEWQTDCNPNVVVIFLSLLSLFCSPNMQGQAFQTNAVDCGIFAVGNLFLLSRNLLSPSEFYTVLTPTTIGLIRANVCNLIFTKLDVIQDDENEEDAKHNSGSERQSAHFPELSTKTHIRCNVEDTEPEWEPGMGPRIRRNQIVEDSDDEMYSDWDGLKNDPVHDEETHSDLDSMSVDAVIGSNRNKGVEFNTEDLSDAYSESSLTSIQSDQGEKNTGIPRLEDLPLAFISLFQTEDFIVDS